MSVPRLRIAYTPDSDDAFYYDALERGIIQLPGFALSFRREPMNVLNQAAHAGVFEVSAISSVCYPRVAGRYAILSAGTSVGRGYGPVLVSKKHHHLDELLGQRVGVAGIFTTGWFLLRLFCPEAVPVELAFDEIGAAVCRGELAAGVMIHEELLHFPQQGLHRVMDLGAEWCKRHGLPLPVGLNVIRRDLDTIAMEQICAAVRRSLQYGLDHAGETLGRVSRYGRGKEGRCTEQFVSMFANEDSLCMPSDVRTGLRVLLAQVSDLGFGARLRQLDIIEGLRGVGTIRHVPAA